jgi:hypothetical protein
MALNVLHLVVGKTRTDKSIICATNLEEIKATRIHFGPHFFSADDLFDAFALFSYLLIRSARKKCDFAGLYEEHSVEIRNLMSLEDYEAAKLRAGVVTVFDLRKLGESLASFEFKDS